MMDTTAALSLSMDSDYIQNQISVIDAETESQLALTMDRAVTALAQRIFRREAKLVEVIDFIYELDIDPSLKDELITYWDLCWLHQYYPSLVRSKNPYQDFAQALMQLEGDRTSLIDWVLSQVGRNKALIAMKAEYEKARNRLVTANMRLVMHIARRYPQPGIPLEDLVQEGVVGLLKASERFNINKGYRFTTYAYWWIQQAVKGALADKRAIVRLPGNINERILKIERARYDFFKAHGRFPSAAQLQKLTGIDEHHFHDLWRIGNLTLSLDEPVSDEQNTTLHECIDSNGWQDHEDEVPHNIVEKAAQAQSLNVWLDQLPERLKTIIVQYHGLDGKGEKTFKDIAPSIGVTLERTRQLYHEAIRSLKTIAQE